MLEKFKMSSLADKLNAKVEEEPKESPKAEETPKKKKAKAIKVGVNKITKKRK